MRAFIFLCTLIMPIVAFAQGVPGLPPVADGKITKSDWNRGDSGSIKFTAVLRQKFPPGFDEAKLIRLLLDQGFKYPPPAKPGCIDIRDSSKLPLNTVYVPCPIYDVKHMLRFAWPVLDPPQAARFCEQAVSVEWHAKDGRLQTIKGVYDSVCP